LVPERPGTRKKRTKKTKRADRKRRLDGETKSYLHLFVGASGFNDRGFRNKHGG